MKKGFTLIELLAVIAIIGVVALIVFPTIMNSVKKSKQNLYEVQVRDIEETGEKWANDHMELLDSTHLNTIAIPLSSLISSEYLQKSNLQDPRDKTPMNGCVTIAYDDTIEQYQYHYIESACRDVIMNGLIYQFENNTWERIEQNMIVSSASAIIESYAEHNLIKTEGQTTTGFYDEGDRYVFRGSAVDNYAKLSGGNEVYRILSIDKITGNIRLMGTTPIPNAWDNDNGVLFENASVTTSQLENYFNSSANGIVINQSKIQTNQLWNVGKITENVSYSVLKSLESGRTAYVKIGLPSISDYIGATTDLICHENIFSDTCKQQNYLYELWKEKNTWTINTDGTKIWYLNANGILDRADSSSIHYIYPVIEIKASTHIIKGDGKSISPYVFE